MAINDNPISMLAIEENQNNFFPIDISELDLGVNSLCCSIKQLDCLIFSFGIECIKDKIKKANVVSSESLAKELVIIYQQDGKLKKVPIITKELLNDLGISELIGENIHDKVFLNRIYNRLDSLANAEIISADLKNDMVDSLKANDINLFINRFDSLPYLLQRELLLFIAKLVTANEREEVVKRIRKDIEV